MRAVPLLQLLAFLEGPLGGLYKGIYLKWKKEKGNREVREEARRQGKVHVTMRKRQSMQVKMFVVIVKCACELFLKV